MSVIFNLCGFFENGNNDVPFSTVYEWDMWQEKALREMDFGEGPIFSDEDQTLVRVMDDHREELAAKGTLILWPDRLEIGEFCVSLDDISQMALHGRETIVFSSRGSNYEITTVKSRNGRKYVTVIGILAERAAAAAEKQTTEEKTDE